MTKRSVTHTTFVIERTYPATPVRVFHAWTDPAAKAQWFVGPDNWKQTAFELDFRVGGREINRGGPPGGPIHSYEARFHDIIPDHRIVYTYDMHLDEKRISVSLATVLFEPEGTWTKLTLTEQGAFLDGYDDPGERERGTRILLDALGAALEKESRVAST